ncbi:sensor histidine kinase [Companilactobacillus metriopterae]|uniref:sensor histidine kinase n=1 Tax=Companilactobacillus metriopterae TaxID=1909267 RepID=UPI001F514EE9|nr:ATP-binding protein [Companilactobacillus metriopterae]
MKNNFKLVLSVILSVIVFFAIVVASDNVISNVQRDMFDQKIQIYKELKKNYDKPEAARLARVKYIYNPAKDKSSYSNGALELSKRGKLDTDNEITTFTDFDERYIYFKTGNDRDLVSERFPRLWNFNRARFIAVMIAYFIIFNLIIYLYYRNQRNTERDIEEVTNYINSVRKSNDYNSIILPPDDKLYDLSQEINSLGEDLNNIRIASRLRKRRFESLIGHLPVGVMLMSKTGQVLLHNQAMANLLGVNISSEIHPFVEDVKTYELSQMIEKTLRKNQNYHKIIQLVGNTNRYVDATVTRLAHSSEEMIDQQIMLILYDLTDTKLAEKQQEDFVNNVSHELKTPITSIQGFAETLKNGAKNDPQMLDHFLDIIYDESVHLNDLVQDILSISKIQTQDDELEYVDVKALIDKNIQHQALSIDNKNIRVETEFFGRNTVEISKSRLNKIIENLLKNAISYNKDGGEIKIEFHHDEIKNRVRLSVEDTGIGIKEADEQRIFERFYQVDESRSKKVGGTGLGLSIVKETVEKMNGDIFVESHLGLGTKFIVDLPL